VAHAPATAAALRREALAWQPLRRMAALGAPIGVQYELEYGVFAS